MSRTNKTKHVEWHKTCKFKRRLDASVCNNKQRWGEDKCRCECKQLTLHKKMKFSIKDFFSKCKKCRFGHIY